MELYQLFFLIPRKEGKYIVPKFKTINFFYCNEWIKNFSHLSICIQIIIKTKKISFCIAEKYLNLSKLIYLKQLLFCAMEYIIMKILVKYQTTFKIFFTKIIPAGITKIMYMNLILIIHLVSMSNFNNLICWIENPCMLF